MASQDSAIATLLMIPRSSDQLRRFLGSVNSPQCAICKNNQWKGKRGSFGSPYTNQNSDSDVQEGALNVHKICGIGAEKFGIKYLCHPLKTNHSSYPSFSILFNQLFIEDQPFLKEIQKVLEINSKHFSNFTYMPSRDGEPATLEDFKAHVSSCM